MIRHMLPITAIAAMLLAGCDETPAETAQDVSEAREEAAANITATRQDAGEAINEADREVASAQQDLNRSNVNAREELGEAEADAMEKTAHAAFEVAEAEAEGRSNIATERCDAFTGAEKTACTSGVEATLASEMAMAVARRDAALAAAESNR